MRLGGRRAGNLTIFMDASSEDVLLKVETNAEGLPLVAFRLYDSQGDLVIDSCEPRSYPEGVSVRSSSDELLLQIPPDSSVQMAYRLYNRKGELITVSDGKRTQIFAGLRMSDKNPPA